VWDISLKKESNIFRTVTFRITAWYMVLLAFLLAATFALLFFAQSSILIRNVDEELIENLTDIEQRHRTGDIEALKAYFMREAEEEGADNVFFVLLDPNLDVRASSQLSPWNGVFEKLKNYAGTLPGSLKFATLTVPPANRKARVATAKLNDGYILQMGISLGDYDELIERFRRIFIATVAMMFTGGGALGLLLTRRAMSGVVRVTKAAAAIGKGNFSHRVPLGGEGTEIQNMVRAFNEMAVKIDTLMNELKDVTNNIVHDLRSPLTRIRGIIETTIDGKQDIREYREMSGIIMEECDRLIGMINTMLEIAEMDQGIAENPRIPVDLKRMVVDACELFTPVAEDKDISIEIDAPADVALIFGDPRRLQRVIANLLDNALKYTPSGGRVIVKVSNSKEGVEVSVIDTGIGIAEGDIPHVFDRFYRGDKSRAAPGNGLGLSLVQAIAKAHRGSVDVKSTPGEGSVFSVYIPAGPFS
jgi:signal transduction histidine kinase